MACACAMPGPRKAAEWPGCGCVLCMCMCQACASGCWPCPISETHEQARAYVRLSCSHTSCTQCLTSQHSTRNRLRAPPGGGGGCVLRCGIRGYARCLLMVIDDCSRVRANVQKPWPTRQWRATHAHAGQLELACGLHPARGHHLLAAVRLPRAHQPLCHHGDRQVLAGEGRGLRACGAHVVQSSSTHPLFALGACSLAGVRWALPPRPLDVASLAALPLHVHVHASMCPTASDALMMPRALSQPRHALCPRPHSPDLTHLDPVRSQGFVFINSDPHLVDPDTGAWVACAPVRARARMDGAQTGIKSVRTTAHPCGTPHVAGMPKWHGFPCHIASVPSYGT